MEGLDKTTSWKDKISRPDKIFNPLNNTNSVSWAVYTNEENTTNVFTLHTNMSKG